VKKGLKKTIGHLARPLLSKVHPYKDKHKGDSCYLMGDGVSVKWFDVGAFSDKLSITSNFFVFHKKYAELRAAYAVLPESFWFFPRQWTVEHPRRNISNPLQMLYRQEVIDRYTEKTFFLNLTNCLTVGRKKNVVYTYADLYDDRLPENFISRQIDCFSGSLRFSILLAIYMGFDHVFLVGHDYTHEPSRSLHWYEKGKGIFESQQSYNRAFFKIATEFVDITTITLDGTSDLVDSVTYKQHTGREPKYVENTELAEARYLKALSSWPGYNI
jgi:hypothetical protein